MDKNNTPSEVRINIEPQKTYGDYVKLSDLNGPVGRRDLNAFHYYPPEKTNTYEPKKTGFQRIKELLTGKS